MTTAKHQTDRGGFIYDQDNRHYRHTRLMCQGASARRESGSGGYWQGDDARRRGAHGAWMVATRRAGSLRMFLGAVFPTITVASDGLAREWRTAHRVCQRLHLVGPSLLGASSSSDPRRGTRVRQCNAHSRPRSGCPTRGCRACRNRSATYGPLSGQRQHGLRADHDSYVPRVRFRRCRP
jgi:hypothetical protein